VNQKFGNPLVSYQVSKQRLRGDSKVKVLINRN